MLSRSPRGRTDAARLARPAAVGRGKEGGGGGTLPARRRGRVGRPWARDVERRPPRRPPRGHMRRRRAASVSDGAAPLAAGRSPLPAPAGALPRGCADPPAAPLAAGSRRAARAGWRPQRYWPRGRRAAATRLGCVRAGRSSARGCRRAGPRLAHRRRRAGARCRLELRGGWKGEETRGRRGARPRGWTLAGDALQSLRSRSGSPSPPPPPGRGVSARAAPRLGARFLRLSPLFSLCDAIAPVSRATCSFFFTSSSSCCSSSSLPLPFLLISPALPPLYPSLSRFSS